MGMFSVPQFIDIEDKIVGPLTAKQLGWVGAGGLTLLILWFFLDFSAFIVVAVLVGGFFGVMAFYKPNGQPMITYVLNAIFFAFRPKIYVWRRMPDTGKIFGPKEKKNVTIQTVRHKEISEKSIEEVSGLLDHTNKS